ncbi:TetR/AcrR family transcriptional regulator [Rhodococcus pseudokoreensis]|uniref:TetR/AcrR family transcriptional regulator n=1 Tax=Rhodococcus pseudokoreensis TaxID=2811421 RepID=A0A974W584_9NOCA|nr:TetR/AcrR family transcriptional regulator [Rhodococcus pseudokoreensis]QSE91508.1 TetR/AcrR family transcriptional regulator [Rhodococcus pseudokoreensis]
MAYVKAAERETQIIAAAIREFSERGVPGTTLRAVAGRAGIPLGTLHYVFASKDQLLRAVITTVIGEISETLRAELEADKGVEHALRHGVGNFWNKLVTSRVGLQIMQYELMTYSLRSDSARELAQLQYERYGSLVTEFCERAAQAAGERCAIGFDTLGRMALAQVDGLILQYIAKPDPDRARRDLDHALNMLVLYADPQPVARTKPLKADTA